MHAIGVWYRHNTEGKRISGGIGLMNISYMLLLRIEGAASVEFQIAEGNNVIVGLVPEGVRVQKC